MEEIRKPFQGVTNIVRFNWHYYIIALVLVVLFILVKDFLPNSLTYFGSLIIILAISGIIISLGVPYYIYDCSNLYTFNWLNENEILSAKEIVNVNAGFDETSSILQKKYPTSNLTVLDFYDAKKHTEISIERARKAYSVFPETKTITTNAVPLNESSIDYVFLILAAHEIRNSNERILFFKQLQTALNASGKIIVVEHQRDFFNFIAYNFGFFHFYSGNSWKNVFKSAGLGEVKEIKITPFISAFILSKNGITS